MFEKLRLNFRKHCPLLFDIIQSLFPVGTATRDSKRHELGAVHSLSLSVSRKSNQLQGKNDVKLMFSTLLISFGAGARLINILCRIGLALHSTNLTLQRKMRICAEN